MTKKRITIIVLVILLAGAGWWMYKKYQNEDIFKRLQTEGEKGLTPQEFQKLPEILSAKYKADTFGSTTPEGTLALFIEALKAGDADLASKYFIPEMQNGALASINKVKNNNRLNIVIEEISTYPDRWCSETNNECSFSKYYETKDAYSSVDLILNNLAGIWKIKSW